MKVKKKKVLFITGLTAMLLGISVLAVFGWKRINREIEKQKLLKECVVFEIPELDIKAPVRTVQSMKFCQKRRGIFSIQVKSAVEITALRVTTALFMPRFSTK